MALRATNTEASLTHIVNNPDNEGFSLIKGSNNGKNIFYSVETKIMILRKWNLLWQDVLHNLLKIVKKTVAVQIKE